MARLSLIFLVVTACGPATYISEVTRGASTSIDRARSLQADRYAPYYYTRAKEYLHAAREDAGRADFQGANRFGKLAREAADKASEDAIAAAADPSKRPLEDPRPHRSDAPTKLAPVKDE
ncbi:MAG: DUF4398 domain-containing protein [Proteobacteria bacterium]|nr:DUF4398 domain-containing protein [Pseudomonadota bacterium]